MKRLLVVDNKDNILYKETKTRCHKGRGVQHRAFSILIFNNKNELLIQKRSKYKKLWPLYWSNSCCSHPTKDEHYERSAKKRLKEELGFTCKLKFLYKFRYKAKYKNIGSENELCAVLIGRYNKKPKINKKEVAEFKFISLKKLKEDIKSHPQEYSPWFKLEIKYILKNKGKTFKLLKH